MVGPDPERPITVSHADQAARPLTTMRSSTSTRADEAPGRKRALECRRPLVARKKCRNALLLCEATAQRQRLQPARRAAIATPGTAAHRTPRTRHRSRRTGAAGPRTAVAEPVAAARPRGGQDAPGLAGRSPTRRPSGGPSSRSRAKRPSRLYRTRSAGTSSSAAMPGTTARAARPSYIDGPSAAESGS